VRIAPSVSRASKDPKSLKMNWVHPQKMWEELRNSQKNPYSSQGENLQPKWGRILELVAHPKLHVEWGFPPTLAQMAEPPLNLNLHLGLD
jgi:hypothetical protein